MRSHLNSPGIYTQHCVDLLPVPLSGNVSAQTAATIVGDITDSSGAVAPNVTVTVINEGTKIERKVQTNEAGQYRVTPLNPGTYTIQVEATGFKREVRSGVVLEVAAVLEVDFSLQGRQVTETIECHRLHADFADRGCLRRQCRRFTRAAASAREPA